MTWSFIIEVLDVLERHGYHQHDDQHTGRAIGLLGDLARIYEGTQDAPLRTHLNRVPPAPETRPPGPEADQDAVILTRPPRSGPSLTALDEAADYKRDRAASLHRLPRPVLPHLPVPPPGRPGLRPPGRPDDPDRRGLPSRHAASPRPASQPQPAADKEAGQ